MLQCQSLYTALSFLLPDLEAIPEGWKSLFELIFVPALQVSNSIKLAWVEYHIFTRRDTPTDNSTAMFIQDLEKNELRDITSHRRIRADIVKAGQDGRIGEEMLWVQPGLLKVPDNYKDILLCQPTILVKLDEPLGRPKRGVKTDGSEAVGDGKNRDKGGCDEEAPQC
jgi:hypothetical protein